MATKTNSANQNQNKTQQTENQNAGGNTLMDNATAMMGGLSDSLGNLPDSVKEIGSAALNRFNRLTTTQKVIGGAALLIGAGYLARRSNMGWSTLTSLAKKASSGNGDKNKNR